MASPMKKQPNQTEMRLTFQGFIMYFHHESFVDRVSVYQFFGANALSGMCFPVPWEDEVSLLMWHCLISFGAYHNGRELRGPNHLRRTHFYFAFFLGYRYKAAHSASLKHTMFVLPTSSRIAHFSRACFIQCSTC